MKRREAREQAFLLVFEMSFHKDGLEETLAQAAQSRDLAPDEYAARLAARVEERRDELDRLISAHSTKWKIDRISRVSLAILRLAVCEILEGDKEVPVGVSINEAVELAKRYGGDEDAPFVNGVLGAYARSLGRNGPTEG